MSAQWLQHHSGHSHQTAGSADPGQHVALTTGQARKLEKNNNKKNYRVTATEETQ